MAIQLPGTDALPDGPARELVVAVHELYRGAGMPGVRTIAKATCEGDYRDTVSHQKIAEILKGDGVPRWSKLEAVVRVLAERHVPRLDVDARVATLLDLWHRTQDPDPVQQLADEPEAAPAEPATAVADSWNVSTLAAMHPDRAAERVATASPTKLAEKLAVWEPSGYSFVNQRLVIDLTVRMPPAKAAEMVAEFHERLQADLLQALTTDQARAVLEQMSPDGARKALQGIRSRKCADLLQGLASDRVAAVLTSMSRAGDVLSAMDTKTAATVARNIDTDQLVTMLAEMSTRPAVAVVAAMEPAQASDVLMVMSPARAKVVLATADLPWIAAALASTVPTDAVSLLSGMRQTDDLALVLDELSPAVGAAVLDRLDTKRAGAVLGAMAPERVGAVLSLMPREQAIAVLATTRFRDADAVRASTIAELGPHIRSRRWWRR